jgi:hypothetical protein
MFSNKSTGSRILSAQAEHCKQMATAVAEARASGAPAAEIADLEEQELAARRRLQELSVDMPGQLREHDAGPSSRARRPWWRIW